MQTITTHTDPALAHQVLEGIARANLFGGAFELEGLRMTTILGRGATSVVARVVSLDKGTVWALKLPRLGFVHLDICPGNLMFDGEGKPRWIDFGAARRPGEEPGDVRGTRGFASPELRAGSRVHARADIYAFAVLANLLLNRASVGGLDFEVDRLLAVWLRHAVAPNLARRPADLGDFIALAAE